VKPERNTGRAISLPEDSVERKAYPLATGCLDYFPDALLAVARVSYEATKQHHADGVMRWERSKSTDEANTAMRHFAQRGLRDTDGTRHTAKAAWRILAMLQKEIEDDLIKEQPCTTPHISHTLGGDS